MPNIYPISAAETGDADNLMALYGDGAYSAALARARPLEGSGGVVILSGESGEKGMVGHNPRTLRDKFEPMHEADKLLYINSLGVAVQAVCCEMVSE